MTSNMIQALALAFLLSFTTHGQPYEKHPAPEIVLQESLAYDIIPGVQRDVGSSTWLKWSCPIPYTLDSTLAIDTDKRIIAAMDYITSKTGWTFVPRSEETDYITFFDDNGACWSNLGRQGGKQLISIGNFCSFASIVHEIGHAIGIPHEQSRADRDSFVNINFENIQSGMESPNFDMDKTTWNPGDYDFNSVMHYGQWDFASNRNYKVITPIVSTEGVCYIGQRSELSDDDINHFNALIDGPACSTPVSETCDPTNIKLCGADTSFNTAANTQIYREYEIIGQINGKNWYSAVTPMFSQKMQIYWVNGNDEWWIGYQLGGGNIYAYNSDDSIEGSTNWIRWYGNQWRNDPNTIATRIACVSPSDYPSISPSAKPSVSPSANSSAPIMDDDTMVNSGELSDVAIIGIIIGCVVFVFAVVCIVDNYYEKRKVQPMSYNQPIYGAMQPENA